jgi:hypothetical protein
LYEADRPSCCAGFKKGASAAVLREVGPLLKSYQEEVDRLTGRAKFGESAFLDIYQKLYEAPDPAPALAAGLVCGATAGRMADGRTGRQTKGCMVCMDGRAKDRLCTNIMLMTSLVD